MKVTLRGVGMPEQPEFRTLARHKKNPEVGTKETVYSKVIYIEQVDAQVLSLNQEVRPPPPPSTGTS